MTGVSGSNVSGSSAGFKRERLRVANACHFCRARKVKCDGGRPACQRCRGRSKSCSYEAVSILPTKARIAVRRLAPAPASVLPSPPCEGSSIQVAQQRRKDADTSTDTPHSPKGDTYYTTHDRFTGDVTATINTKAGASSTTTSNLVPFVNAPLFGQLDFAKEQSYSLSDLNQSQMDHLVDVYWRHVDPVEPVLDRKWFFLNYDDFLSNPTKVEATWLCIINLVCALAIQRQEQSPQRDRNHKANKLFNRAWALLRPEAVLWGSESVELVYCLVLMNRYLHCTNNQRKTWMTAGLAIRMAQSMLYHSQKSCDREKAGMKQKLWATCVSLDRCVSWSLGSVASATLFSIADTCDNRIAAHHDYTRDMELYEIGNQIQLAQIQCRSSPLLKNGMSHSHQQDDYGTRAIHLDACLNKWENSLPSTWTLEASTNGDPKTKPSRYLLHLRLLHTRIFLYRPMLSRVYSEPSSSSSLGGRLTKECATMCLETAQKIVCVIISAMVTDASISILPWWYRIYYLHIAGTHFLAAMCTAGLYTDSVAESWHSVLSALRSHEHLSEYVKQCITTFESLSVRILQVRCGNHNFGQLAQTPAPLAFDDIFQEMGFDFNHFLFNHEDVFSNTL